METKHNNNTLTFTLLLTSLVVTLVSCNLVKNETDEKPHFKKVYATAQTKQVGSDGDAADDPAIWYSKKNPVESKIIGTDKQKGLGVYNLEGELLSFVDVGEINNCDVQYDLRLKQDTTDIVGGSNRTNNSISIYGFDNELFAIDSIPLLTIECQTDEVYGFCFYKPVSTMGLFAISVGKDGLIEQYAINSDSAGIYSELIWKHEIGNQCEGLVADNENNTLYVGEENFGIWKFDLNPDMNHEKNLVSNTIVNKNLSVDIEGLTIYYAADGKGYLIASSQGNNSYAIFERNDNNKYIGSFIICDNSNIDGTSETDGIDVINLKLNNDFPNGVFIAQDGEAVVDGVKTNQNFKLVPWEKIANSFEKQLYINNTYEIY